MDALTYLTIHFQELKPHFLLLLLLVTRPLPRDGGMVEDHGAPEAGQLPRILTRGRKETESPKSERRKESVAEQCRMR